MKILGQCTRGQGGHKSALGGQVWGLEWPDLGRHKRDQVAGTREAAVGPLQGRHPFEAAAGLCGQTGASLQISYGVVTHANPTRN
jgi:hypothetical protein